MKDEPENRSDLEIVRRIICGEKELFELIVKKYQKRLFNSAYRYVGDFHEAEDLTQEIFVKIYKNLSSFKGNSKFSTWIFSITMNHLKSRRRKITQFLETIFDFFSAETFIKGKNYELEQIVENRETRRLLEKEIGRLPEKYREIVILRDINGFSYNEISEILSINMETVKTRIKRGREIIVKKIKRGGR